MDKKNTEKEIINIGLELLQKKGINGFSFADIADKIGIKKASIHYYFPTKIELVNKILDIYSERYFELLKSNDDNYNNLEAELKKIINLYRKDLLENKISLFLFLSIDHYNLTEGLNKKIQMFFIKNIEYIQTIFEKYNLDSKKNVYIIESFLSTLYGAQISSRTLNDISHFDKILEGKIIEILYITYKY